MAQVQESAATVGATGCAVDGVALTLDVPAYFNGAYSEFQFAPINLTDVFYGSHVNSAGATEAEVALVGVEWDVSIDSSCGDFQGSDEGVTKLDNDGGVFDNPDITVFGIGCQVGDSIVVTFHGSEPGTLGSGVGLDVYQDVIIHLITPPNPVKQVVLAWAGQRVMIEHDWRIPAGDDYYGEDYVQGNGFCPFVDVFGQNSYDFSVAAVRGSGPGNFVPDATGPTP